jgi:hypothetical protein
MEIHGIIAMKYSPIHKSMIHLIFANGKITTIHLVVVSEIQVLSIRQVIKSMYKFHVVGLVNPSCSQLILLSVLFHEPPTQEGNCQNKQCVASEMNGKGDEVARCIIGKEDLGTYDTLLIAE